jgi:hypothetical protein
MKGSAMTISEKLAPAGQGPVELPQAAGSVDAPRFEPDDSWLRSADDSLKKAAIWRWFATHFEDPRGAVPNDGEGHFLYDEGEPVQADQVLAERFGTLVPAPVLAAVRDAICSEVGNDWVHRRMDKTGA